MTTAPVLTYGTADILVPIYDERRVVLVDWKTHRRNLPEHSLKWQLKVYAAATLQLFHWAEEAVCYAYLPRGNYHYGPAVLTRDRVAETIREFLDLKDRVRAAIDFRSTPMFNPGAEQCNYCIGKAECPALHQRAHELAESGEVWELDGERLASFLEIKPVLRKFVEDGTKEAKRRLQSDPNSVPGWYLHQTAKRSTVKRVRGV